METGDPSFNPKSDEGFLRCWAHQSCQGCLYENDCNWCPLSWTCVPNNYTIPLLAPAYDENICPYWAERWEIRTRPLGCQVSTITTLTSLVSIASTLAFVLLVFLAARLVRLLRTLHARNPGWWRAHRYRFRTWPARLKRQIRAVMKTPPSAELEPLLAP